MNRILAQDLFKHGIVQFGRFVETTEIVPFKFDFQIMPSYPQLLRNIAIAVEAIIPSTCDRIVCQKTSLPFALAISLNTKLPLVYELGQFRLVVDDLIGAYDIGHRGLFLGYEDNLVSDRAFFNRCRSVGIDVVEQIYLLGSDKTTCLLTIEHLLMALVESDSITKNQQQAVIDWYTKKHLVL